ncbi:hypothetical protein M0804_001288 [Polistes exclamans]|nr:hypothetical protein M0804_001288 [Polistes exclamans]
MKRLSVALSWFIMFRQTQSIHHTIYVTHQTPFASPQTLTHIHIPYIRYMYVRICRLWSTVEAFNTRSPFSEYPMGQQHWRERTSDVTTRLIPML